MRVLNTIDLVVAGMTLSPLGITLTTQAGAEFIPAAEAYELGRMICHQYESTSAVPVYTPKSPSLLEAQRYEQKQYMPVNERPLPDKDELAHRSAGGAEAASKLKVGDAFKAPGDYSDGKRMIHAVETEDLAKLAASAGSMITEHHRP